MIQNYFIIAWRNIIRHKSFSLINIIGLSASMSVCLLIIMVIADQYSFDTYHVNKDRIYRIHSANYENRGNQSATSALPLASKLKNNYAGVEKAVGLNKQIGGDIIFKDIIASGGEYFTDSELFDVLDFEFKEGDPATSLQEPHTMVLTSELADQLFPNESALGKTVNFHDKGILAMGFEEGNFERDFGDFIITGVIKPNPGRTHLPFKLLASQSTMSGLAKDSIINYKEGNWADVWTNYTYVLLSKGQSQEDLQRALDKVCEEIYPENSDNRFAFIPSALTSITPGAVINNATHIAMPKMILIILSILCMVVMLSACLNYTNLSIARVLTRTKEVGVRKVSGANRGQIFIQFIVEAVLLSVLSLIFAYGILMLLQGAFEGLWLNNLLKISFKQSAIISIYFIGFSVVVGFIAGVLPATYISVLNPINLFRKSENLRLFKRMGIRKALLVVQFSVSLIFIITILLIHAQAKHLLNFDYGFDKDHVLTVKLYNPESYDRFAQSIASIPGVTSVGASSLIPAGGTNTAGMVRRAVLTNDTLFTNTNYIDVDANAIDVWSLDIIAGANLPTLPNENNVIINERLVRDLKYDTPEQAIGQEITLEDHTPQVVVGVVKDFHFLTPAQKMENLVLRSYKNNFGFAMIKISPENKPKTVAAIEQAWKKVNPATSFDYKYLDDELMFIHTIFLDIVAVIGLLSFLAILISCLGLLGMAAYTA